MKAPTTATRPPLSREERLTIIEKVQRDAAAKILPGPEARRSADFLYDEDGLPNGDGTAEAS